MTKPQKPLSKRFKIAVIISSLVLISAIVVGAYFLVTVFWAPQKQQTTDQAENYVQKTESINATTDLKKVVNENGPAAEEASDHTYKTNSLEWTDADIDKAYFALVYAAKIGNFTEVITINSKLEDAEAAGKNVSGERVGVSREQREQYVQEASKLLRGEE